MKCNVSLTSVRKKWISRTRLFISRWRPICTDSFSCKFLIKLDGTLASQRALRFSLWNSNRNWLLGAEIDLMQFLQWNKITDIPAGWSLQVRCLGLISSLTEYFSAETVPSQLSKFFFTNNELNLHFCFPCRPVSCCAAFTKAEKCSAFRSMRVRNVKLYRKLPVCVTVPYT